MDKELEKKLADKYSFMQRKESYEEQLKTGCIYDVYSAFGCDVADGWYDLLDEMCAKILAVYDEHCMTPDIIVDQVKEKYGTLRFYYHFDGDELEIHALDFAWFGSFRKRPGKGNEVREKIIEIVKWGERRSGEICDRCGRPGCLRENSGNFLTLCDDCSAELGFRNE